MTITEFLTARYDEDEDWARLTGSPDYSEPHEPGVPAHHERLLADIAAKRAIVALFLEVQEYAWKAPHGQQQADIARTDREVLRRVLHLLAQPFANHPDYDKSWKR